jgi:hypothetical protein
MSSKGEGKVTDPVLAKGAGSAMAGEVGRMILQEQLASPDAGFISVRCANPIVVAGEQADPVMEGYGPTLARAHPPLNVLARRVAFVERCHLATEDGRSTELRRELIEHMVMDVPLEASVIARLRCV